MAKAAKELPKREEISKERTWNLEDIFATDDEWEKAYESLQKEVSKADRYRGRLGESSDTLLELLQLQDDSGEKLGKLFTYAHMRQDQDTTNTFYQAMNTRAENLVTKMASAFSYIVPEILSIDEQKLQEFIAENETLQGYRH